MESHIKPWANGWQKVLLAFCVSASLQANPTLPNVVAGTVGFIENSQTLVVTSSSDRAIIDWQGFSIGQKEVTRFIQPSSTSAILNRVISSDPSQIAGSLTSNGQIFLINPNGILFGQNACVNVSALVASTLDVMNSEFLAAGDMTFSGSSLEAVKNKGKLRADGGVFLLGRQVINMADITANKGHVGLGAGDSILLLADMAGIVIKMTAGTPNGTGVNNSGDIFCNQNSMRANGNLYSLAINHTGTVSALSTTIMDGEIILRAENGKTCVQGEGTLYCQGPEGTGGMIQVLGQTVNVLDEAQINTRNIYGGGTILVGGSENNDPNILQAANTTVGPDTIIRADALIDGNGGTVVIFATNTANFAGKITSRGGAAGGDGGFVELSGLTNLIMTGTVDTRAIAGATGILLIDPTDITISGGATAGGTFDGGSPTNTFSGSGAAATLNITDLNTALNTNNVIVTTTSGGAGTGNITWATATPLSLTATHFLTLLAENDISITSALTASNLSALTLNAANDVSISADISLSGATFTINAGNDILSLGGADNDLLANHCIFSAGHDITLTNEFNSTGNSGVTSTLSWTAGNQITFTNDCDFINWNTATLSTTSGDIVIDEGIVANNVATLTMNAGRDIINQGATNILNDAAIHVTDLVMNATRDFQINSQIDINNFNSATIDVGRDVLISNDFEPDNTTTVIVRAGNDITVSGAGSVIAANANLLNFTAGHDFINGTPFTISGISNVEMIAGNDVVIGGTVNVTGADTTVVAGRDFNLTTVFVSTGTGDISVTTGQDVNIGPAATLSQIGTNLGNVFITTGRDLNLTGGTAAGNLAVIGSNAAVVNSNIELTVGRNANLTAGTNTECDALIGHGFSVSGAYTGDIIIHSVGGNVTLTGGAAGVGATKFAQIGFAKSSGAGTSTYTGNIRGSASGSPALINGDLTLTGGGDTTSYALFGVGGRDSNALETYSGTIGVKARSITLTGGTATDSNASIGYYAASRGGGTNFVTVTSGSVNVISETNLTMTALTDGPVSIGARVLNTAAHAANLNLDLVTITTGGDFSMTSGTVDVETDATVGAFTEFGTASTAIAIDVGGNITMNAQTASPCQIINGVMTAASKNVTVKAGGNISPTVTGAFGAFIEAVTGDLAVIAGGTITLPSTLTFIRNDGATNGTLGVKGENISILNGAFCSNIGTGASDFRTVLGSGDLTLLSGGFISSVGNITGNIARNLTLLDDASITSTMGSITILVGQDISITGASGGSSFISSAQKGIYRANRDITLSGVSATNEGYIENSSGTLQVIAGVDVDVDFFGRITNLGSDSLTIVTDNLFPTAPGVGPGGFILSSLGSVGRVGGGLLRIFTARREQNSIDGPSNLNGVTFVPGTLFVDTTTEQWSTYFPSSFGGSPFTVFYKNGPIPTPDDILAANPNAFVPFSQLFYLLDNPPMDPVLAWLYEVCIVNSLTIPQKYQDEPYLQAWYVVDTCRPLPPFTRKLDLLPFH